MSHTRKTDWEFKFSLNPDHYVYGKIINTSNVRFISKIKDKEKRLVGFVIKVKNSTLRKAEEIAYLRSRRLTNLISATERRHFSSTLVSYHSKVIHGIKHAGVVLRSTGEIVRTID